MKTIILEINGPIIKQINVGLANTLWLRLKGLLGRRLADNEGLLISPCNSVHTMWMAYAIDVIYLTKNNEIIKIGASLKPWRISGCSKAFKVLELNSGKVQELRLEVGDILIWK